MIKNVVHAMPRTRSGRTCVSVEKARKPGYIRFARPHRVSELAAGDIRRASLRLVQREAQDAPVRQKLAVRDHGEALTSEFGNPRPATTAAE